MKTSTVQVFFTACTVKSWGQGTRLRKVCGPYMTRTETNIHFKLHMDYSSASTLTFSVHSPSVVKLKFILIFAGSLREICLNELKVMFLL